MNDTTPQMQDRHRDLLMARSNEERLRMGISMGQTARTIVWSSLPDVVSSNPLEVESSR